MIQRNADLRVIQIMRNHECVFIPLSVLDYMKSQRFNKAYPDIYMVLMMIQDHPLLQGLATNDISIELLKTEGETFLRYLEYLKAEGAILLEETEDSKKRRVGFDPNKFGPLFPDHRKAIEISGEGR